MKTKTQKNIISIFVVLALVVGCFAVLPQTSANPESPPENQLFTGTPAFAVPQTEPAVPGGKATIFVTLENTVVNRGIPYVTIWVDGELYDSFEEIANGEIFEYTLVVDISETAVDTQQFEIQVYSRIGHQFAWAFIENPIVTITIATPEPEPTMLDKLTDAINSAIGYGPITVTVDGVAYAFTSNSGNYNGNGSLFCTIDGTVYRLERNNQGITGIYIN